VNKDHHISLAQGKSPEYQLKTAKISVQFSSSDERFFILLSLLKTEKYPATNSDQLRDETFRFAESARRHFAADVGQ